jgi:hypothetical protein
MEWHFMRSQSRAPPLDQYIWEAWPLAFYNDVDIAKLGINLQGSYLNIDHQVNLNMWYKTATRRLDFDLDYQTPVGWLGKLSEIHLRLFTLDGRQGGRIGLIHRLSFMGDPKVEMQIGFANHQLFDAEYLTGRWDRGNVNNLYLSWQRSTSYRGWNPKQNLLVYFHTSIPGSAFQYSQFSFTGNHKFWDGFSDLEFDVRIFAGYGAYDVPAQYLFNLGGDNSWGEFEQIFYRARGSLPWPWKRNGNLYKSGGAEVKGYSLYGAGSIITGRNALALNLDLKLGNPAENILPYYLRLIHPHVWTDGGHVWDGNIPAFKNFKASAGISLT